MTTIEEIRLQNLLRIVQKFKRPAEAARALNRTPQQINAYLKRRRPIGTKFARLLENEIGAPVGWFDTANPPKIHMQNGSLEGQCQPKMGDMPIVQQDIDLPLEIPKLNLSELNVMPSNEFVDMLRVQNAWLFSQPVATNSPNSLRIVTATSDEMSPTIKRGDIVLLDVSQNKITANGVYALNNCGALSLSRTQLTPNGECELLFDNDRYNSKCYPKEELIVLGRCLLSFNLNPL